ncbi:MAG: arginine--tRNA ligase [Planctomycetota bacterium]
MPSDTTIPGDLIAALRAHLEAAITSAIKPLNPPGDLIADAMLAPAKNPEHGDFQCNAAMSLGKRLKTTPRDLAESIVSHANALLADIAEPLDVAGPGFINIRLKADALSGALAHIDAHDLGVPQPARTETVVVDLCGVNLAKQMHVGHLRATVIGDCLANLFARLGHEVKRQNHFGDWGLPIAMVTARVKDLADAGELSLDELRLEDLGIYYKQAQRDCNADRAGLAAVRRFDLGPKAEAELEEQVAGAEAHLARAKQALVGLQSGDEAFVRVWERISRITLDACFDNCRRLHANVTDEATAGESTYRDELPEVVRDLESRGIAVEDDGALVVTLDEFGIKQPCIIRKSDGGFLYATTDIAGIKRRVQDLNADRVVYAVDARQSLHFKQAFATATKAGYATKPGADAPSALFHAAFGTVLGEDNRPLKSRSGENVRLRDLIDEAITRAAAAVAEKNPSLSDDERTAVAEAVGVSAIKYVDLSSDRVKDYVFSFDRMLTFEGNTGPYLLYALVRIRSIFRKAEERFGDIALDAPIVLEHAREKEISLELLKYAGVLQGAADACEPHRLCAYLYDLAQAFSRFFDACPVLKAERDATRASRLRLCDLTGRVLEDGMRILGLVPVERM